MILHYLQTFCTVARSGSFTKAAEELGYAQSSVTTQIQKLEAEYGSVLFERYGRKMRLTHSGEALLGYAAEMLRLQAESKEVLAAASSGTLMIGTIESLAAYFLPPVLQAFRERYPQMNLQLHPGVESSVIQGVRDGEYDLGVILDVPYTDPELHTEIVEPVELVMIMPPGHRLGAGEAVAVGDLADENLVLTEEGCTYRAFLLQGLKSAGVPYQKACEFGSLEAIKQCVRHGLRVALLPRLAVRAEEESGQLIVRPLSDAPPFATQLIWHKKKWLSQPLRDFMSQL